MGIRYEGMKLKYRIKVYYGTVVGWIYTFDKDANIVEYDYEDMLQRVKELESMKLFTMVEAIRDE